MKVNNKKCFQDLLECQLFLEFPFNIFFFNFSSSSKEYSFLTFHFSKFDENPFYFLILTLFFFFEFFFLSSLNSFSLNFFAQPPYWNKLIKFHLETLWIRALRKKGLIKRLNKVTNDNVSRKKNLNTYMAQSRQKWHNLISQRLV